MDNALVLGVSINTNAVPRLVKRAGACVVDDLLWIYVEQCGNFAGGRDVGDGVADRHNDCAVFPGIGADCGAVVRPMHCPVVHCAECVIEFGANAPSIFDGRI